MPWKRVFLVAAAALLCSAVLAIQPALAERIVRAQFTISLTDPDSGQVLYTSRLSKTSWNNVERCQIDWKSRIDAHVAAVDGYGILNSANTPLRANFVEAHCVVIRE